MTRTLRGAWSRRWTLLPLTLLTVVVVGGTVTVVSFGETAHTSRLLVLPLLLLGLVAVPATARELALARRGEIALARLRGLRGAALVRLLVAEPLVVLVLGGVVGVLAGLLGARLALAAWSGGAPAYGWVAPGAGTAIVLAALVAVGLGSLGAVREPLADQVAAASRPPSASALALFGTVLVLAAAVVAVYRSRVATGAPDWVVLTGPALVGLACGEVVVRLLRLAARALVPLTAGRGLGGFLAVRRVARVADAVTSLRLLVAAAAVAGLALTGAVQVHTWAGDTARLRAGAPLRVPLDVDAADAVTLTHRLDPDGRYLMAAVVVPGTGSVPARRVFLDTARYRRVIGDFYAGTPAAAVGRRIAALGGSPTGLAVGDTVTATVAGVAPRILGSLRPRVVVGYRDDVGRPTQVEVDLTIGTDGAPVTATAALPGCTGGCVLTQLSFRTRLSEPFPYVLTGLRFADVDGLALDWQRGAPAYPGARTGPRVVADGLLVTAPERFTGDTQTTQPKTPAGDRPPILATDTARWASGPPELETPGGDEHRADVLARYPGLPLVQRDGVLADLPRSLPADPPVVPAAQVFALARADTPAAVLAGLRGHQSGAVRTLAQEREETARESRSTQGDLYAVVAVCCLLVALLGLAAGVARQRRAWLRDLAALRVVGVPRSALRGAGRREVAGLVVAATLGTTAGTVLAVRLLLDRLPLVDVPEHAVALRVGLAAGPVLLAGLATAVVVGLVAGRGRRLSAAASRPAVLREEAR